MKKDTIEIFRQKHSVSRYSFLIIPVQITEAGILDSLLEWSKGKEVKIYSHLLRREEENFEAYKNERYESPSGPLHYCDWVYYLDIWYQDK